MDRDRLAIVGCAVLGALALGATALAQVNQALRARP
jgi:hypothetical protein